MAGYSIISDVGNAIVKILQRNMVPDTIQNADAIGLCTPVEKGDFLLGVYLYDIKESEEVFQNGMRMSGIHQQKYPSKFLNLFYMITAYSMSDIKFKASEEQRILGRAVQVLMDHAVLGPELLEEVSRTELTYPIKLEMLRLENEEKMKLWNLPNAPYKLSLYYKVFPVEIESTRVRNVQRVVDVDFAFKEEREKGDDNG